MPAQFRQQRKQRTCQHGADAGHGGEQPIAMSERGIGRNDLDHALVERVDVVGEPSDAAARKALQHGIFQQSGGILGCDSVAQNPPGCNRQWQAEFSRGLAII
jgi:hypothetical protein